MPALTEIIGSTSPPGGGASSAELTALKTDVADIKTSLKPIIGRTVYTTAIALNAEIGDEIHIDGEGTIQLPAAPNDGADIFIFDELGKIKENKNNILLGAGDRWRMRDDTFETAPLIFNDDHLRRGWMLLKYSVSSKSWWPYVHYGTSGASSGTGLSEVQHDAAEQNPLSISSKPSVQFHLEGGGGAKIESSLPDGWWGTVLNTTNDPQPISFDADLTVFLRDGSQIDPVDSPYQLEGNSVVTLQMVDNGFKFLQIIPNGGPSGTGERTETATSELVLAANTWVDIPLPPGNNTGKTIVDYRILTQAGEDITTALDSRFFNNAWQVRSLSALTDLKCSLELIGAGSSSSETVTLATITANTWTDIPSPTSGKTIADYKALSKVGDDITDALESKLIGSQWQVRSLTEIKDVQFKLELV
ncbi:MAG: hypothetical protein ACRC62_39850 [Microcoleus sp.]